MTPATPPATPLHWHRPGGVVLYETRPNAAGQYVWRATHACGCVLIQCCTSEETMRRERAQALETPCHSCLFRARRDRIDEEQARG